MAKFQQALPPILG
jgi:hypothetical protein